LINIDTVDKQLYVYNLVKLKDLSVRATEKIVRELYKSTPVKKTVKSGLDDAFRKIEDNLATQYSTKVKVTHSKKGNGSITIEYFSLEQFNHILKQMGVSVD